MNQPKKERFKTSVGGQALMEGIMMRGPKLICCAVRKPDGTIETKIDPVKNHGIWTCLLYTSALRSSTMRRAACTTWWKSCWISAVCRTAASVWLSLIHI